MTVFRDGGIGEGGFSKPPSPALFQKDNAVEVAQRRSSSQYNRVDTRTSPQTRNAIRTRSHEKAAYDSYRFENWKLALALRRPYFFRSLIRESRVRNPAPLSIGLKAGSYSSRALLSPCLTAPACPEWPPP